MREREKIMNKEKGEFTRQKRRDNGKGIGGGETRGKKERRKKEGKKEETRRGRGKGRKGDRET